MSVKHNFTVLFIIISIILCSCSNVHIDTDKHVHSATEALVSELERNGIEVEDSEVNLRLSGGPGRATITIFIGDCSEEKAQLIFDEIIFPYMGKDNYVVSQLQLVDGRLPDYSISINNASTRESCLTFSSSLDYGLEIWNDGEVDVHLEDYR